MLQSSQIWVKIFLPKPLWKDKRSKSEHFRRLHENVSEMAAREIDWRLRDVNVGLSGRKNVLRKLLRIPSAFVSFCESSDWDWIKHTRCERLLCKGFFFSVFVFVVFSSLENYFGFRTTNVRVKTDNSVSLRWNKTFWTFPNRFVFFW